MTLTDRDLDLLRTLTLRSPMLRLHHVAQVWWPKAQTTDPVFRRLICLQDARFLEVHRINAHPPLPDQQPLFVWQPGADDPDPERVSQQARQRWNQPAPSSVVCVAARRAASLFGSTACGLPVLEHRDHDLRLGDAFVHYRQTAPQLAACWIGEDALPKAGYRIKDPDAFLQDAQGRVFRVIESAGRYRPAQVESFHEYCHELSLPYELW